MPFRRRHVIISGLTFVTSMSVAKQTKGLETTMQLDRADNLPSTTPPERTFTGDVAIRGYYMREAPSRLAGATVTFAPGARTPWKVNPLGQTLIVISGTGWTQCESEAIVEIRAGDVVWYPPGRRHWDGATPNQPMTCVAIHEASSGSGVAFLEAVSDKEYLVGPSAD